MVLSGKLAVQILLNIDSCSNSHMTPMQEMFLNISKLDLMCERFLDSAIDSCKCVWILVSCFEYELPYYSVLHPSEHFTGLKYPNSQEAWIRVPTVSLCC